MPTGRVDRVDTCIGERRARLEAIPYGFNRSGTLVWLQRGTPGARWKIMILGQADFMQLRDLLDSYRDAAKSEHEKGVYFERVVRVYLENDDAQKQYYSAVMPFAEWAKERGWTKVDKGIDLVATLSDGSGYAAIQCKFYVSHPGRK